MIKSTHFSFVAPVFNGVIMPENVVISGYSAIVNEYQLRVPIHTITAVNTTSIRIEAYKYTILPKSYMVDDDVNVQPKIEALYKHLVFALKYEGVNLLLLSSLFQKLTDPELVQLVRFEPTGQYTRRLWFLMEWLLKKQLDTIPDLTKKSYVDVVDTKLQYGVNGIKSSRHLVINNLPGTVDFCPLIFKTPKLEKAIDSNYEQQKEKYLQLFHKDVLQRAAAFLLLRDSKASFSIEGENPTANRAMRWGKAIGQAGTKPLTKEELLRLQQIVIEDSRFVDMGFRKEGGFVGEHDRVSGEPLPEHISAKYQDLDQLIQGILETDKLLEREVFDPVLTATVIAFGFVFIHPFVDGNGRIHRYLIHHILAKRGFTQQGIIFPVSASILNHIDDYRATLEAYSHSILDFIEWKKTVSNNVEVVNETIDYYRYFDATRQAEFLFDCVKDTIENIIPSEVRYLQRYDEMKRYLDNTFEMPDKTVALLIRFLDQNNGVLSRRAREKEFEALTDIEVLDIEKNYKTLFLEP